MKKKIFLSVFLMLLTASLFFQTYTNYKYMFMKDEYDDFNSSIEHKIDNVSSEMYTDKRLHISRIDSYDDKYIVYYNFYGGKEDLKDIVAVMENLKLNIKVGNIEKISGEDEMKIDFLVTYKLN